MGVYYLAIVTHSWVTMPLLEKGGIFVAWFDDGYDEDNTILIIDTEDED